MMGAEDSGRTAMYGAFLAGVPALYWETTHAAGGNLEYGVAMQRLMAHCGLISAGGVLPPPAIGDEVQSQGRTVRRMFHENTGHGRADVLAQSVSMRWVLASNKTGVGYHRRGRGTRGGCEHVW